MTKPPRAVKPDTAVNGYISIYDIPNLQRGTFFSWADSKDKLRTISVSESSTKKDNFGLVEGCTWRDYCKWYEQWDGRIVFPSMQYPITGDYLTIWKIDKFLEKPDELSDQEHSALLLLRNKVEGYMLIPYSHNTVTMDKSGIVRTWYDSHMALRQISDNIKDGGRQQGLLRKHVKTAETLIRGLFETYWRYSPPKTL